MVSNANMRSTQRLRKLPGDVEIKVKNTNRGLVAATNDGTLGYT